MHLTYFESWTVHCRFQWYQEENVTLRDQQYNNTCPECRYAGGQAVRKSFFHYQRPTGYAMYVIFFPESQFLEPHHKLFQSLNIAIYSVQHYDFNAS